MCFGLDGAGDIGAWGVIVNYPADKVISNYHSELNALQLSVVVALDRRVALEAFFCADQGLCSMAQAEGLRMINPRIPSM